MSRLRKIGRAVLESRLGDGLLSTEWGFRRFLRMKGARTPPGKPRGGRINCALQSRSDAESALREVRACGLPPHNDLPKNWDALGALEVILGRTSEDSRVLEVGATLYSVVLPWLFLYGYRRLHGVDLVFSRRVRRGSIVYEPADLTSLRFESGSFDAIASLSVIEHGVDLEAYLREMSRLLRHGGVLVTSTDYWEEPLDTGGKYAYGAPVNVFSRSEIEELLQRAKEHGLLPVGPVDLSCRDKAVCWKRLELDFTFLCFALEKP